MVRSRIVEQVLIVKGMREISPNPRPLKALKDPASAPNPLRGSQAQLFGGHEQARLNSGHVPHENGHRPRGDERGGGKNGK
jgi:hypothetical protein